MLTAALWDIFIPAFVTFFVVIDPPGIAPVFAGLTEGTPAAHKRRMALRSALVATAILGLFAFLGEPLLGALGIGLDAFRAAGGVMLFMIALEMVFEKRTERRTHRAEKMVEDAHQAPDDISVFPMGIPMIAGPGAIASIMLYMARYDGDWAARGMVLAALVLTLVLTLATLLAASALMRLMGKTLAHSITRVFGVILAALAAQLIFDAIRAAFFA
ncbi:MAG: MarC family protein [Pseudomonadota bacterium]